MKGIFISYRRDDTASEARLLYNQLRREFGDGLVFMDVEALREPGADFVDAIHASLNHCDAVLAVMGRRWAGFDRDTGSSRLDAPGDFIRMELSIALQRGVRVIPVLVDGAAMPPAETLPEDLRALTRLQAVTLTHEDWEFHVGKLIDALARMLGYRRRHAAAASGGSGGRWPLLVGGAVAGILVMAAVGVMLGGHGDGEQGAPPAGTAAAPPADLPYEAAAVTVDATPDPYLAPPVKSTTTADMPTTPEPRAPAADPAMVAHAQRLLARLGYEPGQPDGVPGSATGAAVRAFQDDYGAGGAPGQVSEPLIAMLERAVAEDAVGASAGAAAAVDIAGVWYTDDGLAMVVTQSGPNVVFHHNGERIGQGQVTPGAGFELLYGFAGGLTGYIVGSVDPDGRHIRGTDTSSLGMVLPVLLHYEHRAGE